MCVPMARVSRQKYVWLYEKGKMVVWNTSEHDPNTLNLSSKLIKVGDALSLYAALYFVPLTNFIFDCVESWLEYTIASLRNAYLVSTIIN